MKKINSLKISLTILVFICCYSNLQAQVITSVWTPGANPASTGLWNETANWSAAALPDANTKVVFNVAEAMECQLTDAATIRQFVLGDGGVGGTLRIKNGGHLTTTTGWSGVGWNNTATLIVETGGMLTYGGHMWVSGRNPNMTATVIIEGGTVNVANGMFGLNFDGLGGFGVVNVKSGLLNLTQFHATQSIREGSLLDIREGTVTCTNDITSIINEYIALGRIKAYGGSGTLNVVFNAETAKTTITATAPTTSADLTFATTSKVNLNRATKMLSIENISQGSISFSIYDMNGKVIAAQQNCNAQIQMFDMTDFSKGVYFVKVNSAGKSETHKIIL
jgi:hypothetical protein